MGLRERLAVKVDRRGPDECWPFGGAVSSAGYGIIRDDDGRLTTAHRATYELDVGPVPEGHDVDHVHARGCRSKLCCNPAHLEAVTHAENVRRGLALRTHCRHGHPYDQVGVDHRGHRYCLRCRAERREHARSKRAA